MTDLPAHALDECSMRYLLLGDFNPDEVTAATRIVPSAVARKGEVLRGPGQRRRTEADWQLDSGLPRSDQFGQHLRALIDRLVPAMDVLVALGAEHRAHVEASVCLYESQGPLIEVPPDAASTLGRLNATLGFDLYVMPERDWGDATSRSVTRAELAEIRRELTGR